MTNIFRSERLGFPGNMDSSCPLYLFLFKEKKKDAASIWAKGDYCFVFAVILTAKHVKNYATFANLME